MARVGDDSDEESGCDEIEKASISDRGRQKRWNDCPEVLSLRFQQIIIIASLLGIIVAASLAIVFAAILSGSGDKKIDSPLSKMQEPQQLLEIAERVVAACGENELNEDMSKCQRLCRSKMCCFDIGEYSCREDDVKYCAVYAGCEALVKGIPVDSVEKDEK